MNKALLQYEMERQHVSINAMLDQLHISRSAFWRKRNGVSEFTQSEIKKIIEILHIEDPMNIFFCDEES